MARQEAAHQADELSELKRELKRLARRLELQYDELVRQIGRTTERDIVIEREQNVHDYEEDEDLDEGRPFPEEWE